MNNRLAINIVAVMASLSLLAACNSKEGSTTLPPSGDLIDELPALDDITVLEGLPEGTVQTGANTFMVPLEKLDADGCQGYRLHSPGRLTVQAIFYRMAGDEFGEFTFNKLEAACRQDVSVEKDDQ